MFIYIRKNLVLSYSVENSLRMVKQIRPSPPTEIQFVLIFFTVLSTFLYDYISYSDITRKIIICINVLLYSIGNKIKLKLMRDD